MLSPMFNLGSSVHTPGALEQFDLGFFGVRLDKMTAHADSKNRTTCLPIIIRQFSLGPRRFHLRMDVRVAFCL